MRLLLHGSERSGPPIYVTRLLQEWGKAPRAFDPEVVIARPGPLTAEIERRATTRVARLDRRSPERSGERLLRSARLPGLAQQLLHAAVRQRVGRSEPSLTVVNGATAPTVELLLALDPSGPVVTIAHELSTGWFANLGRREREVLLERSVAFLAVSRSVRDFLRESIGIDPGSISVVPPPVAVDCAASDAMTRPESGRSESVVAGMGVTDWRKAPEVWLRIAATVRRLPGCEDLRFVWAGGDQPGSPAAWSLEHEVNHLDLGGVVTFLGAVEEPWRHLGGATVMVSTAREDAYPLACAESIARGVPVAGFDIDGVGEMVRDSGCGTVVSYGDECALADAVAQLVTDPCLRSSMSQSGRVWARHTVAAPLVASRVGSWIEEHLP